MSKSRSSAYPAILGGEPVFNGTRVPVKALFDYLEGGESLQEFLDDFPTVSKELAIDLLKLAEKVAVSQS